MVGRPLPIHTFVSFAAEPGLGRNKLSHAAADSGIGDRVVASAEEIAAVLGVPLLLSEMGKLAEGGIAPSLMAAAGAPECG